ncbi:hypothetical protein STAQ_28840 [Allostella sp. ATCC 35155]|nr:hypothetical protein STAQ_28840 [Stella sp. ATCC 35155]
MRPVRRGPSPQSGPFDPYSGALGALVARTGRYCSYCERQIATMLAVEHIQAKALPHYAHLETRWENFLLACVNCNSTKGKQDVRPERFLLPDRDNTSAAFTYTEDGMVEVSAAAEAAGKGGIALDTLKLTGLDRSVLAATDPNALAVALDRVGQRREAWLMARHAQALLASAPANDQLRGFVVRTAQTQGYSSIWMTVFVADADMKLRLIEAFQGTAASGCFDPATGAAISPAPNPDGLPGGGKL